MYYVGTERFHRSGEFHRSVPLLSKNEIVQVLTCSVLEEKRGRRTELNDAK